MDSTAAEESAAYAYVDSQVPTAVQREGTYGYLWHGHALREAFMAGAKWQREHPESKPVT